MSNRMCQFVSVSNHYETTLIGFIAIQLLFICDNFELFVEQIMLCNINTCIENSLFGGDFGVTKGYGQSIYARYRENAKNQTFYFTFYFG